MRRGHEASHSARTTGVGTRPLVEIEVFVLYSADPISPKIANATYYPQLDMRISAALRKRFITAVAISPA